jgi:hypothetical protein
MDTPADEVVSLADPAHPPSSKAPLVWALSAALPWLVLAVAQLIWVAFSPQMPWLHGLAAAVIGWTVRQTWWQRRAGVATLVAATAAGTKHYRVIDIPAEQAWAVAVQASLWVAESAWAGR